MTLDYAPPCKAYTGNNKTNIVVPIFSYSFIQKLLSSTFLMVLWVSCILSTIGFSCSPKSSDLPKGMEFNHKVPRLPHHTTRCVGSVSILGMGDPVDYIRAASLLSSPCQYVIDHDNHGNVTFKRCNIDPNPDPSDHIAATHPMDDTIPNWEGYGLTRLRSYQRPILNDTHISLDLGRATFQSGKQLGFILVKPNVDPTDLVKHLLEKRPLWSEQSHVCTEDYLILPGIISEHALHGSNTLNAFTKLNLNSYSSYSNLYCYIKKDDHYCLIPLENTVSAVATAYSASSRPYEDTSKSEQAGPSSLASNVAALPESPSSLKQGEPLDALPKANGPLAEDRPINRHTNGASRPTNLLEELKAAGYNPISSKMGDNSALSEIFQDAEAAIAQEQALEAIDKNITAFKTMHENVIKLIKKTKIVTSDDIKEIKNCLSGGNKIQSALSSALKAIKSLQSALKLEKAYQLGIEYSSPTNLNKDRKAAVQRLTELEKAVWEGCSNVSSAIAVLQRVREYLEEMHDLLHDIRQLLSRADKTHDIRRSVKQLFIGNSIQLKKRQDIIAQLEQMEDEQLKMIQNFKQTTSEILEPLGGIWEELVTSIGKPLERVTSKICSSDLKLTLQLESNICEGRVENPKRIRDIIAHLELEEEDIQEVQALLNRVDAASRKKIAQKIEEAFHKVVALEAKLKTEIPLKVKEIVNQSEGLIKLCRNFDEHR